MYGFGDIVANVAMIRKNLCKGEYNYDTIDENGDNVKIDEHKEVVVEVQKEEVEKEVEQSEE